VQTLNIIAYQRALRPALPTVVGPLDYRQQRELFERMDRILEESKLDEDFLALAIADQGVDAAAWTGKQAARFARYSALCLRANVARCLLGLAHRQFCSRLADSPLLQWFLHLGEVDSVKVFAKSTSARFERWVSAESLHQINTRLLVLGSAPPVVQEQSAAFGLKTPVVCEEVFFDTTCIKANVHFPTDWVLLRDAVRTLMKATLCIRAAGLKQRMPQSPEAFLRDMNKLCMAMSAQRRTKDSKKQRKRLLRQMKALAKRIAAHARAHRQVLEERRAETELSEGQARLILTRIDSVLEQLPQAIKQAHERIIGGRQVANEEKILSLYDSSVEVILRGKAGAEVEFGNKLSLAENKQGLVLACRLHEKNQADTTLVAPMIKILVDEMKLPIGKVWADRGMFSKGNEEHLQKRGIESGLCPRNVEQLAAKLKEPGVREGMKRRGSTEARVAIFKNVFLGSPARGQSHEARQRACGWAVLTHNLWVLARLPQAGAKKKKGVPRPASISGAGKQAA
jgi:hypothetical protein